jgi:hypothetical protein
MATPLTDIYDFFLSKVSDYSFIRLNNTGDLEAVLYKYLRSAVVKFINCNKDLTIDEVNQQFISDLDMDEKEILATLMAVEYVIGQILDEKSMKKIITPKDYQIRSQVSQNNHLKDLIELKKELNLEASQLMNTYSLKHNMGDLL